MADSSSTKQTASTAVTETTSNKGAPTYGGFTGQSLANSLLSILSQSTQQVGSLEQGRQAAFAEAQSKQHLSDGIAADAATAAGIQAARKAQLNYQQNSALESYQRELGMDPSDPQNILSQSLAQKEALRPQYEATRAEYDKAAGTDLLSNPLGFIMAQLKLPSLAAKTNALSDAMGRADVRMQVANEQLDTRRRTLIANSADQIREFELKQADIDAKIADSKLRAAEAATASRRAGELMQQIQVVNTVSDNQRQTIGQLASLREQEENRVERRQRMALVEEQRRQMLDEKKAKADQDARLDARLAAVSQKLGMPEPMTVQRLRSLASDREKNAWLNAALNGQMGETLYESLLFYGDKASRAGLAQGGNASSYDAYTKLRTTGLAHQAEAEREAMKTGKKLKPEEARAQGFNIYADRLLNSAEGVKSPEDLSSRKWDSEYNPYRAPALAVADLAQSDPRFVSLKNNEVAKAISSFAATAGIQGQLSSEQEQVVLKSIYEQARSRKILPAKAAADIAAFYRTAADFQYQQTQYDLFGLPKQKAYLYSLEIGGERKKVDLFNPAELERALQRSIAGEFSTYLGSTGQAALPGSVFDTSTSIRLPAEAGLNKLKSNGPLLDEPLINKLLPPKK